MGASEASHPGEAPGRSGGARDESVEHSGKWCDGSLEVVVVDGGSDDDTVGRATAAGARVVASAPGRARQLQAGAEATTADVVVFLHADARLPVGWEKAVSDALVEPEICGGAFRFRMEGRGALLRLMEWGVRLRVALFTLPYGDQAIFVRRTVLQAIGGVPQVPLMEDLDLVAAMKKQGRLALLALPVTSSARRYRERGVLRMLTRNLAAALLWSASVDRDRIAAWYRR